MTGWILPGVCWADFDAQAIALNCMTCHAPSVENKVGQIPSLANLSEHQLRTAILDYKYDRKPATLMPRIVKGYSDQTLSAVARYLARH